MNRTGSLLPKTSNHGLFSAPPETVTFPLASGLTSFTDFTADIDTASTLADKLLSAVSLCVVSAFIAADAVTLFVETVALKDVIAELLLAWLFVIASDIVCVLSDNDVIDAALLLDSSATLFTMFTESDWITANALMSVVFLLISTYASETFVSV